jgi:hypothetical protein
LKYFLGKKALGNSNGRVATKGLLSRMEWGFHQRRGIDI